MGWLRSLMGLAIVGFLLTAMPQVGCRRDGTHNVPVAVEHFTVVMGAGEDDPYWPVIQATARRFWDRLGLRPEGLRVVAPRQTSVDAQVRMLRILKEEGMSALCLQVIDSDAIAPLLESFLADGVAVATMIDEINASMSINHCGWNHEALAGQILQTLLDRTNGGGPVTLVLPRRTGPAQLVGSKDRRVASQVASFKKQLADYPGYRIVEEIEFDSSENLSQIIQRGLARFPTMRAYISFGPEPLMADKGGGWPAERILSEADETVFIGLDPLPETWPAIASEGKVVLIGADYGEIAPLALGLTQSMLMQSGRFSSGSRVPFVVVDRISLSEFKEQWNTWIKR